ncbi:MAG TPA: DNA translocase FtsK 4TM domain-containing protein, partial [Sphingomonas sp.]
MARGQAMAGGVAINSMPWRMRVTRAAARSSGALAGVGLIAAAILVALALASYGRSDPAINTAAAGPPLNWLGYPGSYASDLLLTLFGPGAGALVPIILVPGVRLARGRTAGRWL